MIYVPTYYMYIESVNNFVINSKLMPRYRSIYTSGKFFYLEKLLMKNSKLISFSNS